MVTNAYLRQVCEQVDAVLWDAGSDWNRLASMATVLLMLAYQLERWAGDPGTAAGTRDAVLRRTEAIYASLNWTIKRGFEAQPARVRECVAEAQRQARLALSLLELQT